MEEEITVVKQVFQYFEQQTSCAAPLGCLKYTSVGRGGGGGGGMNCLTMLACSSVTCKKIGKDKIVKRVVYHLHSAVFTCLLCSARTNKKTQHINTESNKGMIQLNCLLKSVITKNVS